MADDLYDQDFYLWTQAQAEALRAHDRGSNRVDWDRVAEEVDDVGKRELHACESRIIRIIEHLHKLRSTRDDQPRPHWRAEIAAFRDQVDRRLTPSIRAKLQAEFDRLHKRGAAEAARWLYHDEAMFDPIDETRRWPLEAILGEADDPLPVAHWTERVGR